MPELTLDQPYLVFRFYYATHSGITPEPAGDHVLRHLVNQLVQQAEVDHVSLDYMRYSEGGYHIYLKIRGNNALLNTMANTLLVQLSQEYQAKHHSRMGLENELGEYSVRLHQRIGADHDKTHPSGHYSMEWQEEDPQLYESSEIFKLNLHFNDLYCRQLLQVLELDLNASALKSFVRLLLSDLLLGSQLSVEDNYYLLYFVRQQWIRFFDIDTETLKTCDENAARSGTKFHMFLDQKQSYQDSVRVLPEVLRPLYLKMYQSLLPVFNQLIVRDELGVVTNQTALRVISLLHLGHNRMGFDLNQEITYARLLSSYLEQKISTERREHLVSGANLNIENYVGDLDSLAT